MNIIELFKNQFNSLVKEVYNQIYKDRVCVKTPGLLIDELFTTDMKIWFLQEKIMAGGNAEDVAKYSRDCQSLNAKRNKLIKSIDESLNFHADTVTMKTYQ